MEPVKTYREYYDNFISTYQSGIVSAEQAGKAICDLTQYFCDSNLRYADCEIEFSRISAEIEQSTDDNGKQLSSTKAKTIAESRPEYSMFLRAKREVENIEQILKSMKALQMGILSEFKNVGGM